MMKMRSDAKAIRELEKEKEKCIPIIAMTALGFEEDKKRCFQSGMNEIITNRFEGKNSLKNWKLYQEILKKNEMNTKR